MAAPTMSNAQPRTLVPLLPAPEPTLQTMSVVVADDGAFVLEVRTVGREVRCPLCHQLSTRVQSRYRRTLADLSAQGVPVRVRVEVRRFRCATHGCVRRIFTERLAPFAVPYVRAWWTPRMGSIAQTTQTLSAPTGPDVRDGPTGDAQRLGDLLAPGAARAHQHDRGAEANPWGGVRRADQRLQSLPLRGRKSHDNVGRHESERTRAPRGGKIFR